MSTKEFVRQAFGQLLLDELVRYQTQTAFEAHWREESDFPDFRPGLVWLGRTLDGQERPVGADPAAHCLTLASSRSGKGISLLVPNALKWPGSLLCVDPKGENATITARERLRMGQRLAVLDPLKTADVPEECRARFNPLDLIESDAANAESMARLIASTFIEASEGDKHFGPSAFSLFAACILFVCDGAPPEKRTLDEVRECMCFPPELQKELLERMAGSSRKSVRRLATALQATPEKERASFFSSARTGTDFLDDAPMQEVFGSSTFKLADLKDDPAGLSLYLCMPIDELETYAKWFRLMVRLALKAMLRPGDPATGHRTLFLLDEFHALGHVQEIENSAPLMAGAGVLLWPFVQQIATLRRDYPKAWPVFVGNASVITAFGIDGEDAELVSRRLGEYSDHHKGHNISMHHGRLLTAQQVEQAFAPKQSVMLVLDKGEKPGVVGRVAYFRDTSAFPSWHPPHGKPGPQVTQAEPVAVAVSPNKEKAGIHWTFYLFIIMASGVIARLIKQHYFP